MADQGAELFLPAHGLPIGGVRRIKQVLTEVADALEKLVSETITLMNEGARLNDIVHTVKVDPDILAKPYLKPMYDEPEFVVNNIWRLYGGWYGGNPAYLKPARESDLAVALAELAGGAAALAKKGQALAEEDIRTACHLVEIAVQDEPDNRTAHAIRAEVFQLRRNNETSLMAKGIFGSAANESRTKIEG
jgi:alkyl sulfatase BDS1-like metallo-beta-lactamase superfamily hydrolase